MLKGGRAAQIDLENHEYPEADADAQAIAPSTEEVQMKRSITPKQLVKFLNELVALDPKAMNRLFNSRVPVGKKMAEHKTVQVVGHPAKGFNPQVPHGAQFGLGVIGVLNGAFGIFPTGKHKGWGCIAMCLDDRTKKLVGFTTIKS